MYETNMYEGMLAETVSIGGAHGDQVRAYFARPLGPGRYPGIVLIHHRLGWDEWYRWATREFAYHGFGAIAPNLYTREGCGKGRKGWFALSGINVSYDCPYHIDLDHALNIDFVNEAKGPGGRVAVELTPQSARKLAEAILAV